MLAVPLYALLGCSFRSTLCVSAIAAAWMVALALSRGWLRVGGRGSWWAAHALQQGGVACASAALVGCVLCGLRSGFLPWLWAALPAAAGCAHALAGGRRVPAGWWAVGAVLPALQTWYLALGSLRMLVPMTGRAGEGLVPPDVSAHLSNSIIEGPRSYRTRIWCQNFKKWFCYCIYCLENLHLRIPVIDYKAVMCVKLTGFVTLIIELVKSFRHHLLSN